MAVPRTLTLETQTFEYFGAAHLPAKTKVTAAKLVPQLCCGCNAELSTPLARDASDVGSPHHFIPSPVTGVKRSNATSCIEASRRYFPGGLLRLHVTVLTFDSFSLCCRRLPSRWTKIWESWLSALLDKTVLSLQEEFPPRRRRQLVHLTLRCLL